MKGKSTDIFVDGIEGGVCRLLAGSGSVKITIPQKFLPRGVKEGDWLTMEFREQEGRREKEESETKDLLASLGDICQKGTNI